MKYKRVHHNKSNKLGIKHLNLLKLCTLLFFGIGLLGVYAQETIAVTGGNASGSGGTTSYSVGQMFYHTNTGTDGSVIEGIQIPYEISVVNINYSKLLSQGWTWFSINVDDGSMNIADVLGSLHAQEHDYIKNQTQSATYYFDYGWFGNLENISLTDMYKTKLAQDDEIIFEGQAVDPSTTPIILNAGWNWISYIPQETQNITTALSSIDPVNSNYIKTQRFSSTYFDNYGWFGLLEDLQATEGYMMKVAEGGTLTYPSSDLQITLYAKNMNTESLIGPDFNPHTYEFNGSITAQVIINEMNAGSEENILYAFVGDECRGKSAAKLFPPTAQYVYNLMIHSNVKYNELIIFKFYDESQDQWYDFSEKLLFEVNMIKANAFDPFELKNVIMSEYGYTVEAYPNPVSDHLILDIKDLDGQNLSYILFDINGRVLRNKVITKNRLSIAMEDLLPATYFLRILNKQKEIKTFKIVKK